METKKTKKVSKVYNFFLFLLKFFARQMKELHLDEVYKDDENKRIIIYNELYFYGMHASPFLAEQIAKDAENDWNEPEGIIEINGENYLVFFIIKGFYVPLIDEEMIQLNRFVWRKFFKIDIESKFAVSYVDAIFSNSGLFLLKNIEKPNSKTAAHELGHSWGLLHPENLDYRGKGQPHIMFPRGTLVDAEFRYKPEAEAKLINGELVLEQGCTVHTDKRKVTQFNIDDLGINRLKFNKFSYAPLSKLTNIFH